MTRACRQTQAGGRGVDGRRPARVGPNAVNLRKISLVHTVTPAEVWIQRT